MEVATPPYLSIYREPSRHAKVPRAPVAVQGGSLMQTTLRALVTAGVTALSVTASAAAQETHVVRLLADPARDEYRFEPARLAVRPNDVVVFRVASGAPHSIVFEGGGLSPDARGAFNAAMPERSADLSSPLLTGASEEYRMVVPRVSPGTYSYYCLPHRAYDMRGSITVK
jgi:plastocyanin